MSKQWVINMNIGKSIKIALAQGEKNTAWIAGELKISTARVSAIARAEHHNTATIQSLAGIFGMSVSEFIALGEE